MVQLLCSAIAHDEALLLSFDRRNWWLEIGLRERSVRELERARSPLMEWLGHKLAWSPAADPHVSGTAEIIAGGADFVIYRIQESLKRLLGKDIAGRDFAVYSDDTFIVPIRVQATPGRASGCKPLEPPEEVTFASIENEVPDTEAQSRIHLRRVPRPRFIRESPVFSSPLSQGGLHRARPAGCGGLVLTTSNENTGRSRMHTRSPAL